MLKNYLKVALRNLLRHKTYSFINIFGLATGIACCILILLFVREELSYDRFHANAHSIFRITLTTQYGTSGDVPPVLAPAMREEFPEIAHVVRFVGSGDRYKTQGAVKRGDKIFKEEFYLADRAFFEVFSFPLLAGNATTTLSTPASAVINKTMAEKYFGSENPLGKILSFQIGEAFQDMAVTGVVQIPENSSLKFDFLLPYDRLKDIWGAQALTDWGFRKGSTFVLLKEGSSLGDFSEKLTRFVRKKYAGLGARDSFALQPLTDIHLNGSIKGTHGLSDRSHPAISFILSAMALIILAIACINFMNLAIGQSALRSKEVGMRKVLGAFRRQLTRQFLGEAMVLSVLALLLGMALAELFLPTFNSLAGKRLSLHGQADWQTLTGLIGLMVIAGVTAGSYPALVLSRFHPVEVLKNKLTLSGPNLFGRALIVTQFALSVFLIIATTIIAAQVNYMKAKDVGFDKENVIVIQTNSSDRGALVERFRNALTGHDNIISVTTVVGPEVRGKSEVKVNGFEITPVQYGVDDDYLATLRIPLVEGRNFSRRLGASERDEVIVNETFVREAALPSPLGQQIDCNGRLYTIVGVVKNFHFASVRSGIMPLVLYLPSGDPIGSILVRVKPGNMAAAVQMFEEAWATIAPDLPFQYSFLDEDIESQYRIYERMERIVGYSSLFAILIACFGLFGITTLAVTQRTKEIGIRKVLGASVSGVVRLIGSEFMKLVMTANLIAWPAAYFLTKEFLQKFPYRINLGVEFFLLAAGISVFMALLTVGCLAVKAALANPVEALRYE